MTILRVPLFLSVLILAAACSTPARGPASTSGSGDAADGPDRIRLVTGETVEGRIVEDGSRQVLLERETVVSAYPRSAIFSIDYAKSRWQERRAPLQSTAPSPDPARPATTWLPRTDPGEPIRETEVLFHDTHPFSECVGPALAKAHQDLPDLRLFAEPGGRLVLHDPKQWGYHAHLPGGVLRIPTGKPGLSVDLPREEAALPDWISFVSPAQEIRAGDGEGRGSYAIPDALTAAVKPLSAADPLLAVQPFAGGKPAATPNGTLWAFTLPRNSRQFIVYLLDPSRRHGEILKAAYAGYGDTILAADLLIDVLGADGLTLGRVLVVPYPDNVSADGPAREPLTVYAGPVQDPTAITTLALPPRETLQLPAKAASLRAEVLVSHYDVSASIPQAIVLAHGLGRPTGDVALVARALTPKDPDEIVRLDVSSLPEERFPTVAWLYQRRTFVWKTTGGYLPPVAAAEVPPRREVPLAKVRRSEGIPHVIPLLFTGTRPPAAVSPVLGPAAQVAGGMASGLLHDAFVHGGPSLTQNIAPATPASQSGAVSNVTYVYISSPPHTPESALVPFVNRTGAHAAVYRPHDHAWDSGGFSKSEPATGAVSDPDSGVQYNPQTGMMSAPSRIGTETGSSVVPVRQTRR
jgi:hypothetical protein